MKKQTLTRQDIQNQLLEKLSKLKVLSAFLTVVAGLGLILYPIHLVNYLRGTPFDYTESRAPDLVPPAVMIFIPALIMLFVAIILYIYYIDLYNIKRGNFQITEEKLCAKEKERVMYYRHHENENFLYFADGKAAVAREVYASSSVGDMFYVVRLKFKRNPYLVYHTKYYKMDID